MKVKLLGSVSPYCKDNKMCSGYLIDDGIKILLDCGSGISSNMNFPEDLINLNIIISHLHKDHYSDLFVIYYAALVYYNHNKLHNIINVFIPSVKENDKEYLDYLLIKKLNGNVFSIHEYDEDNNIEIDTFNISVMNNHHAKMNSYSIRVRGSMQVTYSGDVGNNMLNKLTSFASNSHLLIIESSLLSTDLPNENHLTTIEAATVSKNSNSMKTIITHMFPEYNKEDYLKEALTVCNNIIYSEENKVIEL